MTSAPVAKPKHARKCPICGQSTVAATKPFCSRTCADVDLLRWLRGAYAIPGDPIDDADNDPDGGSRNPQN